MQTNKTLSHEDNRAQINAVIEAFLVRKLEESAAISPYYHTLWLQIARLFRSGGKRLRSRIVLLSYSMLGGKDESLVLPAAAAQELLHLGMLIHDDIIDRDYIRYGIDNVAGSYRSLYADIVNDPSERLHYAHSASLLAGDLMISEAYLLMAESNVSADIILAVQKLLGRSIFEVIGGELLDTESAFREVGAISPEQIALYKTASYSFTMPMLVGAQLAGASHSTQIQLRELGRNLGIAFQLRDDVIGVFGDEAETGKSASGDIREGKQTYMIEQFNAVATDAQKAVFEQYFGNPTISEEQVTVIRELLVDAGALKQTEQAIQDFETKARQAVDQLQLQSPYADQMTDLITTVTKRVK